jgi:uncharacterized membrane protein
MYPLKEGARNLRSGSPVAPVLDDDRPIVTSALPRIGLAVSFIVYASVFSASAIRTLNQFGTPGFDLGIFDQGVWLLSRFKSPFVTVRGLNLFGDHTSFILLFAVPLYWIFSSASVLLVLQSLALGLGALPVFLIAREKLRNEWLALMLSVAYLAQPVVGLTNHDNFHPDSFEIPLILFAVYFMIRQRWRGFFICVILVLLVKEDVPLLTFTLGLYVALRYDRNVGLVTAALSVLWLAADLWVIIPAFNPAGAIYSERITGQFGGLGGFLKTFFTHPWDIVKIALGPERPWYLWQLFAPLALLSLLAPGFVLIAAGPLLSNLLSTFGYQHGLEFHYSTLIAPTLVAAAIIGIARWRSFAVRATLVAVLTCAALVTGYMWGPFGRHTLYTSAPPSAYEAALNHAIGMIPDDASVSTYYGWTPHLTHREHLYEFPNPWVATNWGMNGEGLPDPKGIGYVLVRDDLSGSDGTLIRTLQSKEFEVLYSAEHILLMRRI